ncbi:MAG: DUF1003 domain-containing protein [Propionibacteriaceae bacterium]|jgi:uncharacterized membrane protein|nr:DUF1003 domain-containing protein [Propionibacteriaceae bacterium]
MAETKLNADERLDTPGRLRGWRFGGVDGDAFGRFSEWVARVMGSPAFIIWMTVFIIVWIVLNSTIFDLDPAPSFIMLTLLLSVEAAYSAPLILLAQSRQEQRDRAALAEDRRVAAQSRADTDYLAREIAALRQSVGEVATRDFVRSEVRDVIRVELREQLRELLSELDRRLEPEDDAASTKP